MDKTINEIQLELKEFEDLLFNLHYDADEYYKFIEENTDFESGYDIVKIKPGDNLIGIISIERDLFTKLMLNHIDENVDIIIETLNHKDSSRGISIDTLNNMTNLYNYIWYKSDIDSCSEDMRDEIEKMLINSLMYINSHKKIISLSKIANFSSKYKEQFNKCDNDKTMQKLKHISDELLNQYHFDSELVILVLLITKNVLLDAGDIDILTEIDLIDEII